MASRNRKPAEELEELEDMLTPADRYAEFLEELGDEGIGVTIFRFPKQGKDMEWCDTVTIDQAGLDLVREKYGPGKYRLTFKREGAGYVGHKTIKIAELYTKTNGAAAVASGDSKRQEFMETLLLSIVASMKPAPPPDVGGLLAGIGAMMQAQKPVSADPASMLTAMATVFTQLNPKRDTLEEVSKIVEIANGLKPDSGKEENLYTVARDLGDKVIDAFAGRSTAPAAATVAATPRAALPPGATPVEMKPQPTQEEIMLQWLRGQLTFLKEKARAGKNVEDWIDYIFENQEEPGCGAILMAIERGASFENLLQFDPEIGQNPLLHAWFETLYKGIYDEFKKPVDTAGGAGNASDSQSNAAPGPGGQQENKNPGVS